MASTFIIATAVPRLPPVPLLERPLESPWILVGALASLGLLAFWLFNARGKAVRGLMVGGALLALALVIGVISTLVVTPREVLRARSAALTEAVATGDVQGVRGMVHPTAKLYSYGAREGWDMARILSFVEVQMDSMVHDYGISRIDASIDGPEVARTQVYVTVDPEATRVPTPVVVRLDWQFVEGRWQVVQIDVLYIAGVGAAPLN